MLVSVLSRYISTLYINEGWPDAITCQDMANDLKKRFNTNLFSHFHLDYKRRMDEKAKGGQPVRFTDFFGMAIGDALLPVSDCNSGNNYCYRVWYCVYIGLSWSGVDWFRLEWRGFGSVGVEWSEVV